MSRTITPVKNASARQADVVCKLLAALGSVIQHAEHPTVAWPGLPTLVPGNGVVGFHLAKLVGLLADRADSFCFSYVATFIFSLNARKFRVFSFPVRSYS